MKTIIVFFLLISPSIYVFSQSSDVDFLIYKKSYNKAKTICKQKITDDENLAFYSNRLGRIYDIETKTDSALYFYQKAYNLDSLNTEYGIDYANFYNNNGLYSKAYKIIIKILKYSPENVILLEKAGEISLKKEDYASASTFYKKLISLDSLNFNYWRYAGLIQFNKNNINKAIYYYSKAFDLNHYNANICKTLANLFFKNEMYDKADSVVEIGLLKNNTEINLLKTKANIYFAKKEYFKFLYIYEKIDSLDYKNENLLSKLGVALFNVAEYDSSLAVLETLHSKLFREGKPQSTVCFFIAMNYQEKREFDKSIYFLNLAERLSLNQKYLSNIYFNKAENFNYQRKISDALANYKIAYKYNPEDKILLYYIAKKTDELRIDKKTAVKKYQQFLKEYNGNDKNIIKYSKERIQRLKEDIHFEGR